MANGHGRRGVRALWGCVATWISKRLARPTREPIPAVLPLAVQPERLMPPPAAGIAAVTPDVRCPNVDAGIIIRMIDFSGSTLGRVGAAVAENLDAVQARLVAAGTDGYLWDYGFNSRPFPLDPQRPCTTLRTARRIQHSDFTLQGFVSDGTNLSLALVVACEIGIEHRRSGHSGPITVLLWTDGWDTNGQQTRPVAQLAAERAREVGVKIEVHGFCPQKHWHHYLYWLRAVGLRQSEALVQPLGARERVEESVSRSLDGISLAMDTTLRGGRIPSPAPHPPDADDEEEDEP